MITLAITSYERTDLLFESFKDVIDDDRISEIVIVDDCSSEKVYKEISHYCSSIRKVNLYRNDRNLDCYKNKREAIAVSLNEWVILFDSDNIISKRYVDRCEALMIAGVNDHTVYQPSFARPHFDFTKYSGSIISKYNASIHLQDSTFQTMLNAMNYFVNRKEFLRVWKGDIDPVTSDSIYHNYNWLNAGNDIYVVPDLEYEHRVHDGSHYKKNVRRTPHKLYDSIIEKLNNINA